MPRGPWQGGTASPPGSPGARAGHARGLFLSRLLLPVDEVLRHWAVGHGGSVATTGLELPSLGQGEVLPLPQIPLGLPNAAPEPLGVRGTILCPGTQSLLPFSTHRDKPPCLAQGWL